MPTSPVNRYVTVNERLLKVMGFFMKAEGSCSARGGVRLSIGNGSARVRN